MIGCRAERWTSVCELRCGCDVFSSEISFVEQQAIGEVGVMFASFAIQACLPHLYLN